ncbi:hypothetical protein CIL05_00165 [Virgibacillus profundi]|uniref:Tripartite tricarboxylate transporter substrate binding protein n=1 Tax=Virgibacillus profundi TaxID=2024555 RepID=A0A2A2IH60_9BACI|nr:tripartite tricarboxylate transporter substrate binding protein [Virgibacillus profundi]PAV31109.1 hypothetical protein CIL05_00165 [Virgibacillus profundi]PXY55292.1 tripartite tricarboxylate transporter substrate binding protein [Virgibacillus profundi]
MKKSFLLLIFVSVLLIGCSSNANSENVDISNYPEETLVWLTPFSTGGATDVFSREIGRLFKETGVVDGTFTYENHPGAGGQIGLGIAIEQRIGDNNTLIPFSSTFSMLPYLQGEEYSYKDLTIVAQYASDYNLVLVHKDSPYKTLDDLIEAGKQEELTISVSGIGGTAHVLSQMLTEETGTNVRAVPFESSGEQLSALLGNNVDFSFNNPSEAFELIESGDIVPLAITSPERIPELPDVPTLVEQGVDLTHEVSRGLALPPGVSDDVRDYWIEKSKELVETPEFQEEYIEPRMMTKVFADADEYKEKLEKEFKETEKALKQAGIIE